ncbi:glycoside hydrolase family 13 protein [Rufibacter sediminis]|uniref:Glycoside hydrolase family 13 protein n=1 Tax=Rufibacter sediminis TaxID=2762756 RepID=A0ABR6VYK8_9BACT|nr:glycoside hydrolase family 13 protein [Rufibacter sediminis]MBC3542290.1 glycoside hydrolase family 13 protein [Rufibacter sediminis]
MKYPVVSPVFAKGLAFLGILLLSFTSQAQKKAGITRIDPTFWWVGMKNQNLQLLVYGPNAGTYTYTIEYPGVQLLKTHQVENPNYAFLDLSIAASTKPGSFTITGRKGKDKLTRQYELKARTQEPKAQGVTSADFIYLVLPDRFANGDPKNDKFKDMADTQADRKNPFLRHGGDIKGIQNHLNYFEELGVTALWLNPIIENNQPLTDEGGQMRSAYHGYAFTDHYQVDKRLGGNEAYKKLIQAAHAKGMKIVQDAVYNHVGINHWFIKDMPSKDWVHQFATYTNTSHKFQPIIDPHAAQADWTVMMNGWFTPFMPDLNQNNPFVANYLIQHALWTVEHFGVDAWRIDTYMYNDDPFMNRCNQALLDEYPNLHIFGEAWVNNVVAQSRFTRSNINFPNQSNQPGTLDFVLFNAMNDALNQSFGWDEGVSKVHQVLALDAVYQDPMKLVTFLDNHDMNRYFSVIGEDLNKYKMGLTWLLTTRGIPSLYYGTEILMKNFKDPSDAEVRRDFPGGFAGDKENKFTSAGRNERENEAFNFVKKLATYRKNIPALHSGKLMQFVPQDGLYVYFRYDESKTIMVATNSTDKEATMKTDRFAERLNGFTKAKNVLSDENLPNLIDMKIPAKTALVLELQK